MGDVGGTMSGKHVPDASQNASELSLTNREKQPHSTQMPPETGQRLIDCLNQAQGVLQMNENEFSGLIWDEMTAIL